MTTMIVRRANKELQAKLRAMVEAESITDVSARLEIGRESIAKYLADLPLQVSTFRGLEASIADAELGTNQAKAR